MHSDDGLSAALALKARLPRSWPAFFERHGSFSPAQLAAIPALLDGANLLLCAPTASGKTAAVLAPLIERHCPPLRPPAQLRILYLVPTRALVNDLRARLVDPLASLGLRLGVKTHDSSFPPDSPPEILITTPESVDALLASAAQIFATLRAVVIDELHLFDGTPRGDQLRIVLNRIRQVRAYATAHSDTPTATLQYAALSATLSNPAAVAVRYFAPVELVQVDDGRPVEAELLALDGNDSAALQACLADFRMRGWRKALVFCNSRAEVEWYAAATRPASPFGSAVFVHYSNIEAHRRREIEAQFAAADSAICFSSSTLELGIDIGSVNVVLLIGPPGSAAAFMQRVGRGNRRGRSLRAICAYRTPLEQLQFDALLAGAHSSSPRPSSSVSGPLPFRPAVAVQQIFSLIKQSPTAALRLAPLSELFIGMLHKTDLETLLGHLVQRGYLQVGRPGEWRAGPHLNRLFDEQNAEQVRLSIYSNIQGSTMPMLAIRDQHTQQTIARVDALWLDREELTLEGRQINVTWSDGEALWISTQPAKNAERPPIYRSTRQLLSYELAQLLPVQLGFSADAALLVQAPSGYWCFHWLGDRYGRAIRDMLRYTMPAEDSLVPGLALHLPEPPRILPALNESQVLRYLRDSYRQYEVLLDLGPFQQLLPTNLRRQAVVEQFDVPRFLVAANALRLTRAPEQSANGVVCLLG